MDYTYTDDLTGKGEITGVIVTYVRYTQGAVAYSNFPESISFGCRLKHDYIWNDVSLQGGVNVTLLSEDEKTSIKITNSNNDWDVNFSSHACITDEKETSVSFTITDIRETFFNYLKNKSGVSNFNTPADRKKYLNTLKEQPEFTKAKIKFYLKRTVGLVSTTKVGEYIVCLRGDSVNNDIVTTGTPKIVKIPTTNSTMPTVTAPIISSATTNKNVYYRKNDINYYNNSCLVGKLFSDQRKIQWHSQPVITLSTVSIYTTLRTPTKDRLIPIDKLILRLSISNGYFDTIISLDSLANSNTVSLPASNFYNKDDNSTNPISTSVLGPGFIITKFSVAVKDMMEKQSSFSGKQNSVPFICSNGEIRINATSSFPEKTTMLYELNSLNNSGSNLNFTWENANGNTNNFVSYYYEIFYCDSFGETPLFKRVGAVGLGTIPQGSDTCPVIKPNGTNGFSVNLSRNEISYLIRDHFKSTSELVEGWFKITKSLDPTFNSLTGAQKVLSDKNGLTLNNVETKLSSDPNLIVNKKALYYNSSTENYEIKENQKKYNFNAQKNGGRKDIYINSTETYYIESLTLQTLNNVTYKDIKITIKDKYWDGNSAIDKTSFQTILENSILKSINNNNSLQNGRYLFSIGPNYDNTENTYKRKINYGEKNDSNHYSTNYSHLNYREIIIEVAFEYNGKKYTEINKHIYKQDRLNIFFCDVDAGNFKAKGKVNNFSSNSDFTEVSFNFSNLFQDLGGCQNNVAIQDSTISGTELIKDENGKTILGPYAYGHLNFYNEGDYDNNSIKVINRRITCTYNGKKLEINGEGTVREETVVDFKKTKTEMQNNQALFGSLAETRFNADTRTYTLTNNNEKIFGVIEIKIEYVLFEGAYYTDTSSSVSPTVVPGYTLTINTAQPTIYKRPFSLGVNQYPGDQEVLRIDLPTDVNKKYLSLGDKLLIDLTTGTFYTWASDTTTTPTPSSTTVYINMLIPKGESDFTNAIPYREAIWKEDQSLPSAQRKYKIGYRTYTKKTSF